jgi:hypothetical protein
MLGMKGFGEIVNDEKLFKLQEMQPNHLIESSRFLAIVTES